MSDEATHRLICGRCEAEHGGLGLSINTANHLYYVQEGTRGGQGPRERRAEDGFPPEAPLPTTA
jgi:hypothetical protein